MVIGYYFKSYAKKIIVMCKWCIWLMDDDMITLERWHCFFIVSFDSYNIHDWWQNDMDVQDIIWKCD
jgi:hypothetical protein